MVRKQEFDHELARFLNPRRVGSHHHFIGHGESTGSHQRSGSFYFHYAQAASRGGGQILAVTKVGDGDSRSPGGLEDGRPFFGLYLPAVDGQMHFSHFFILFLSSPPKARRVQKKIKTSIQIGQWATNPKFQ
jgi:hypothetical protein